MDTDHPRELDRFGFCTRCARCVDWAFMTPYTTPSGCVEILCARCERQREPMCQEQ